MRNNITGRWKVKLQIEQLTCFFLDFECRILYNTYNIDSKLFWGDEEFMARLNYIYINIVIVSFFLLACFANKIF